ncbi:hypothetical protein [Ancylobacter terrae]|uniref:hypothetical protein n=1 Tax=Ancylobacter sp. sgz301288 TaxID=3342077 RepID=UPI00385BF087
MTINGQNAGKTTFQGAIRPAPFFARREEGIERRRRHLAEPDTRATAPETKPQRLDKAIENGLVTRADFALKA